METMLTREDVAALLKVSRRTVSRMVKRGTLPQPIRFNRKTIRWNLADIVKVMKEKERVSNV